MQLISEVISDLTGAKIRQLIELLKHLRELLRELRGLLTVLAVLAGTVTAAALAIRMPWPDLLIWAITTWAQLTT